MAKERTACDDGEGNTEEIDGSFLTLGVGCSTENTEAPVHPGPNAAVSRSGRINSGTFLTLVEGNSDAEDSTYNYISNIDNPERILYDSTVKDESTRGAKNNMLSSADFGGMILMNVAASPGPSSNTTSGSGVREEMPIRSVDCANFNENMDGSNSAVGSNYSDSGSNTDISGRKHDKRFLTFDKYCADLGYDLRARVDTAHSLISGADLGNDLRARVDTAHSLISGADLGNDLRARVDTAHNLNIGAALGYDLRGGVDTGHSLNSGADLEVNYGLGSGPSNRTGLAIGARPSRSSQKRHTTSEQSQQASGVGVSVMPPPMGSTSSSDAQIHGNYDIPTPLPPETTLKKVAPPEYLSSPVPYRKRLMQQQHFTFLRRPPPKPELPYQNLWPPVADERAGNLSFSNNIKHYGLGSGPSNSTGLAIGARPSRCSQMRHTTSEQSQQTSGAGVSFMPPPMGSTSPSEAQIHGNYDIPTPLPPETTLKRVVPSEYLSCPVPYKKHLMQQQDFTFLRRPPPTPELPCQNLRSPVADERAGNLSFSNDINQTYPPNHPQTAASLPPPPPNACRPPSSKRPCDYCNSSVPPAEATIEDCGHKYHINCLRKSRNDVGGKCFRCESSKN